MNLSFKVSGIEGVRAWLQKIQAGFKNQALLAFTQYIVGDDTGSPYWHGLKHYPPYHYVSYAQAYGGFKSDKQRRYVMAMISEGKIDPGYPHRTGEFQRGWHYTTGVNNIKVTNDTPYGGYLMGDDTQANMPNMIGWRTIAEVIQSNMAGAIRHANAKVKEWLATQKG